MFSTRQKCLSTVLIASIIITSVPPRWSHAQENPYAQMSPAELTEKMSELDQIEDLSDEDVQAIEAKIADLETQLGEELDLNQKIDIIREYLPDETNLLLDAIGVHPELVERFTRGKARLEYLLTQDPEHRAFLDGAFAAVSEMREQDELQGREAYGISGNVVKTVGIGVGALLVIGWIIGRIRDSYEIVLNHLQIKLTRVEIRVAEVELVDRTQRVEGRNEAKAEKEKKAKQQRKQEEEKARKKGGKDKKAPKPPSPLAQHLEADLDRSGGEGQGTLRSVLQTDTEIRDLNKQIDGVRQEIDGEVARAQNLGAEGSDLAERRIQRLRAREADLLKQRRELEGYMNYVGKKVKRLLQGGAKGAFILFALGGALYSRAHNGNTEEVTLAPDFGKGAPLLSCLSRELPADLLSQEQVFDPYGYTRDHYDCFFNALALQFHAIRDYWPDYPTRLFSGCFHEENFPQVDPLEMTRSLLTILDEDGTGLSEEFSDTTEEILTQLETLAEQGPISCHS